MELRNLRGYFTWRHRRAKGRKGLKTYRDWRSFSPPCFCLSSFLLWNVLCHPERWPSPTVPHQSKAHPPCTAFPMKLTSIYLSPFWLLWQIVSVPCLFAMDYMGLNIFIIVPRAIPHVPHAFCVLLKSIWTTGWAGADASPCSFSPHQQPI